MSPSLIISIALLLSSSLPSTFSQQTGKENCTRDLCSGNYRPGQCRDIIKANYDGFNTNDLSISYTAINLTGGKAVEILDLLNQLHNDSDNNELKEKYQSRVDNYTRAIRDIGLARSHLDMTNMEDSQCISTYVHTVLDDFEDCRNNFNETLFDPAHILDRNHEFFVYAQIANAAATRVDTDRYITPN